MSITISENSSKKIGLVAEDGGPLLLKLKNCLAYGINKNNKFGKDNYTIPTYGIRISSGNGGEEVCCSRRKSRHQCDEMFLSEWKAAGFVCEN
jgi:hypothetical protein